MIQSAGVFGDLVAYHQQPKLAGKATEYYINKRISELNKKIRTIKGSGITLTNNEIKDIMKVIKSLENRGILLKGTTTKTAGQEEGFVNFLRSLMTAGLLLIKIVLTALAKSALLPLRL